MRRQHGEQRADDAGQATSAPSLAGVGATAVMMARERAVETLRGDRLFVDPWAQAMVTAALTRMGGAAALTGMGGAAAPWLTEDKTLADIAPGMAGYVAMRTRWLDDRILTAARVGGVHQLVLLGAGLDTRAARMTLPNAVRVFTVDQPAVLDIVTAVLADGERGTTPRLSPVPADLSSDWVPELLRSGFDTNAAAVWVVEGLLMYLSADDADQLVDAVRRLSRPSSVLLADLAHPNIACNELFAAGRQTLHDNASPIRFATDDPRRWLARHAWDARVADPVPVADTYHREVPPALDPRRPDGPTFVLTESHTDDTPR